MNLKSKIGNKTLNEMLFYGFFPRSCYKKEIMNIEIDGFHHILRHT